MTAYLKPLLGKYYRTGIIVEFKDGSRAELDLTLERDFYHSDMEIPSERELKKFDITEQDWIYNIEVESCFVGNKEPIQDILIVDSHTEDKYTYTKALELVESLNKR